VRETSRTKKEAKREAARAFLRRLASHSSHSIQPGEGDQDAQPDELPDTDGPQASTLAVAAGFNDDDDYDPLGLGRSMD